MAELMAWSSMLQSLIFGTRGSSRSVDLREAVKVCGVLEDVQMCVKQCICECVFGSSLGSWQHCIGCAATFEWPGQQRE